MSNIYRDITLEQVGEGDIGKTVRAAGWIEIFVIMAVCLLWI